MDTDLIIVSEYCRITHIEPSFIFKLERGGLIELDTIEGVAYLTPSQLHNIERFSRMYYDLSINVEGIDAINHLLGRMQSLQKEIKHLKNRLNIYEVDDNDIFGTIENI